MSLLAISVKQDEFYAVGSIFRYDHQGLLK